MSNLETWFTEETLLVNKKTFVPSLRLISLKGWHCATYIRVLEDGEKWGKTIILEDLGTSEDELRELCLPLIDRILQPRQRTER